MMGSDWAGGGSWVWMLGGLVLIAIIVLVVWMVARTSRAGETTTPGPSGPSGPTATQILSERFARGEISEQEYERAKKALDPGR